MIRSMIRPMITRMLKPMINPGKFPNSVWNVNGTINCSGIIYCNEKIRC